MTSPTASVTQSERWARCKKGGRGAMKRGPYPRTNHAETPDDARLEYEKKVYATHTINLRSLVQLRDPRPDHYLHSHVRKLRALEDLYSNGYTNQNG